MALSKNMSSKDNILKIAYIGIGESGKKESIKYFLNYYRITPRWWYWSELNSRDFWPYLWSPMVSGDKLLNLAKELTQIKESKSKKHFLDKEDKYENPSMVFWPSVGFLYNHKTRHNYKIKLLVTEMISLLNFSCVSTACKYYKFRTEIEFLRTADGLIFVVDSQNEALDRNIDMLDFCLAMLGFVKKKPEDVPLVFQLNKRDLPNIISIDVLKSRLKWPGCQYVESIASKDIGVYQALDELVSLIEQK